MHLRDDQVGEYQTEIDRGRLKRLKRELAKVEGQTDRITALAAELGLSRIENG